MAILRWIKSRLLISLLQLACILPPLMAKTGTMALRAAWIIAFLGFVLFAKFIIRQTKEASTNTTAQFSPQFRNLASQNIDIGSKVPGTIMVYGFIILMTLLTSISYYPFNISVLDGLVINVASIGSYPFILVGQVQQALAVSPQDDTAIKISAMLSLSISYCILVAIVMVISKLDGAIPDFQMKIINSEVRRFRHARDLTAFHYFVGIIVGSFGTYEIWWGQLWASNKDGKNADFCLHPLCFGQTDLGSILACFSLGMASVFMPSMIIFSLRRALGFSR